MSAISPFAALLAAVLSVSGAAAPRVAAHVETLSSAPERRGHIGGWARLYLPPGFDAGRDSYDVVVHFHGAPTVVEPAFAAARVDALLVTVNLGNGSRCYRERFADDAALEQLLAAVEGAFAETTGRADAKLGRVALSAWSAGHGALLSLLAGERSRARVDAVLVADGLHASFLDPAHRLIHPASVEPFLATARAADRGETLMIVTHSAIATPSYASTTETSRYLVDQLGVPQMPPRSGARLRHARGALEVLAYPGNDAPAHAAHLQSLRGLAFEPLRAWWQRATN